MGFLNQLKAILYRKGLSYLHSIGCILFTYIVCIILALVCLIVTLIMKSIGNNDYEDATMKAFVGSPLKNVSIISLSPFNWNNDSYPVYPNFYDPAISIDYSKSPDRLWNFDFDGIMNDMISNFTSATGVTPNKVQVTAEPGAFLNQTFDAMGSKENNLNYAFGLQLLNGDPNPQFFGSLYTYESLLFRDVKNGNRLSGKLTYLLYYNSSFGPFKQGPSQAIFIPYFVQELVKMGTTYDSYPFKFQFIRVSENSEATSSEIYVGPITLSLSLAVLCCLFINQIVDDVKTPQRPFMISYGLSLGSYWLANFIIDFCLYEITMIIVWVINYAAGVHFIRDHAGITFYLLFINAFSFIFFSYFFSFLINRRIVACVVYLFITIISVVISFIIVLLLSTVKQESTPEGTPETPKTPKIPFARSKSNLWLNSLYPATDLFLAFYLMAENSLEIAKALPADRANLTISTSTFFSNVKYQGLMVGPLIFWAIWAALVVLLEFLQIKGKKMVTNYLWTANEADFAKRKEKLHLASEVYKMEEEVEHSSENEFAVKIVQACKVFKNSDGIPFPAVNSVSLGVKKGSLFGFLGANGAGKTTLINMIQNQEPLSKGSIEINGHEIRKGVNAKYLSVCPQFDDHLSPNLTGRQNLLFLGMLQGIKKDKLNELIDHFIQVLKLTEHANKRINEMSGGNRRKTAVAAAFLSQSEIVLLDEPTASLDPVARKCVHELINEYRGERTFMLTTHLLAEAESLCDNISIMVQGCVFAIGSPAFLSTKFGTSYKIDITCDIDPVQEKNLTTFFRSQFPKATTILSKPGSRIYQIDSAEIGLYQLFSVLQKEKEKPNSPIVFYSCSSSTLEKVFLQIVALAEDDINAHPNIREGEAKSKKQKNNESRDPTDMSISDISD